LEGRIFQGVELGQAGDVREQPVGGLDYWFYFGDSLANRDAKLAIKPSLLLLD
jgi:hypothetical protein